MESSTWVSKALISLHRRRTSSSSFGKSILILLADGPELVQTGLGQWNAPGNGGRELSRSSIDFLGFCDSKSWRVLEPRGDSNLYKRPTNHLTSQPCIKRRLESRFYRRSLDKLLRLAQGQLVQTSKFQQKARFHSCRALLATKILLRN